MDIKPTDRAVNPRSIYSNIHKKHPLQRLINAVQPSPGYEPANVLPYAKNSAGNVEWAVPKMVKEPVEGLADLVAMRVGPNGRLSNKAQEGALGVIAPALLGKNRPGLFFSDFPGVSDRIKRIVAEEGYELRPTSELKTAYADLADNPELANKYAYYVGDISDELISRIEKEVNKEMAERFGALPRELIANGVLAPSMKYRGKRGERHGARLLADLPRLALDPAEIQPNPTAPNRTLMVSPQPKPLVNEDLVPLDPDAKRGRVFIPTLMTREKRK